MNMIDATARLDRSGDAGQPGRELRRWWTLIAVALAVALFLEAIFAGSMLSGLSWARRAHATTAIVLIASAFAAGLTGLVTLRCTPHGRRLGFTLLSLAGATCIQAVLGVLSAKGANLTWIHVPLGVALVSLAGLATLSARRLGDAG